MDTFAALWVTHSSAEHSLYRSQLQRHVKYAAPCLLPCVRLLHSRLRSNSVPCRRRYRRLDAGSLVLWAIAVATVVSAALWAGYDYTREALAARAGAGAEVRANMTHALVCGGLLEKVLFCHLLLDALKHFSRCQK